MLKLQLNSRGDSEPEPQGRVRAPLAATLGPEPARHALSSSAAKPRSRRPRRGPRNCFRLCYDRTGTYPDKSGLPGADNQEGLGGRGCRTAPRRGPGEPAEPAPSPARTSRRLYRSRRGPADSGQGGTESPAALVAARRPASPRLAHATLADDEDLQGGQHVLVHPDAAPL